MPNPDRRHSSKVNVVAFPATGSPPKLLDRVRHTIRMRHYSRRTESTYVHWIRRFIVFHEKKHPDSMGAPEITAFLSWLATNQHVSASTQNQALSALVFLYKQVLHIDIGPIEPAARGKMPHRIPVVLSSAEAQQILSELTGVMWLVVALLNGAGLRLQECLELRVKHIDFDRHEILGGTALCAGPQVSERRDRLGMAVCVSGRSSVSRSAVGSTIPIITFTNPSYSARSRPRRAKRA